MQQEERSSEAVEVDVKVIKQQKLAVLVTDGTSQAWVPYSQILDGSEITQHSEPGFSGVLMLPEWKALALGLL